MFDLTGKRIHFIGIGGSGMSGIARIMLDRGMTVSGSDKSDSAILKSLATHGAKTYVGHAEKNVGDAQVIVKSAAINVKNPELVAAKSAGLLVIERAEALSWLMQNQTSIAIAGTHGKTTTTAMLTVALQNCGADPSFAIGGTINASGINAHNGKGNFFIAEADESDGSFLAYKPTGAIITNIELDHVDHFKNLADVEAAFLDFVNSIAPNGFLVADISDPGVAKLLTQIARGDLKIITYGKSDVAEFQISDIKVNNQTTTAKINVSSVFSGQNKSQQLQLQIPGEHNALNATAVFATALHLGFEPTSIMAGLNNYSGTKRRFELKGMQNGVRVVDDYGHHPTEISATLKAARSFAGTGRVLVIFQPHRFSRTQAFEKEFAQSLAACDFAIILEIYAASETAIAGVSGLSIAKHLPNTKAKFQPAMIEAVEEICNMAKPGDVIITLGAGDVSSLGEPILNKLTSNK